MYVVDLKEVNVRDLTCDDSGGYSSHSCSTCAVKLVPNASPLLLKRTKLSKSEIQVLRQNKEEESKFFYVKRQYSYRLLYKRHARQVIKCENVETGVASRYAIIQYMDSWTVGGSHGNAKHNESYIRTKPSILQKARELGKYMSAKRAIHHIDEESGGPTGIKSALRCVTQQTASLQCFSFS